MPWTTLKAPLPTGAVITLSEDGSVTAKYTEDGKTRSRVIFPVPRPARAPIAFRKNISTQPAT